MNYFENVYLGKKQSVLTVKESKKLQKLLSAKALMRSTDSRGLNTADLKRMAKRMSPAAGMDIESYMKPYGDL